MNERMTKEMKKKKPKKREPTKKLWEQRKLEEEDCGLKLNGILQT